MAPQRRIDVVLDSVRRLLRLGATANLQNLLQKQHPADLGQIFGELHDAERAAAFTVLVERQPKLAMESLSELGPERGAALLAGRSAEEIAKLLQEIPSDDAAALVDYLPDDLSNEVLELMRRRESGQVESLLDYAEQTAGRIMNPNVFALSEDLTVGEAISALQNAINVEMVFYLYVVDVRRHLVGVTSLRRLLLVAPETPLKRIMTPDVFSVRVDTDQEEAARLVASYNLLAIPVVDEENKLAGVITVDDVIDVLKDEATEDLYRLAGVSGDERIETPAWEALKKRLPWLGVNLVTAFAVSRVIGQFETTIAGLAPLAALMPIVASIGGNTGNQTMALVIRALAVAPMASEARRRLLRKELVVSVLNGGVWGLLVGLFAVMIYRDAALGVVMTTAVVLNLVVAAVTGVGVPLLLASAGRDPAHGSSVLLTFVTDAMGCFLFLGLAHLFLA